MMNAYVKTLVSYIDILGFSSMVDRSRREPSEIAKLSDRLTAMKRVANENTEHRRASGEKIEVIFNSFSFSDLVVRCTQIGGEPPWFILLMAELHYLASRQVMLAEEGVLVRGSITTGSLLVDPDENLVFGPALSRSYELESKKAIYPRIVIDQELGREAMKSVPLLFDNLIHRGEDGTFFLDYLCTILTAQLNPPMAADRRARHVRDHGVMIERALRDPATHRDESLKQKYTWLALYHNAAARRIEERLGADQFRAAPELLVSESALET